MLTFYSPRIPVLLGLLAIMLPASAQAQQEPPQANIPPGLVVISGAVPDEATKANLLTRLQEVYGTGKVIDQISVGGVDAPPNWGSLVPKLVNQNLKSIAKGQITVEGTTVSLRGEVGSEALRQSIAGDVAGALNPGYVVRNGLRVTAASQEAIDKVLANRVIEFEPGSALLTDTGKLILDEMIDVLKKLDAKKFEVIGHTDNVGVPDRNLALSRSRAESVKTYLVANGIRPELISTSGMGADQPLVSNNTQDGRRRNRRIEFRASQ